MIFSEMFMINAMIIIHVDGWTRLVNRVMMLMHVRVIYAVMMIHENAVM